jgi:hypothetical protein
MPPARKAGSPLGRLDRAEMIGNLQSFCYGMYCVIAALFAIAILRIEAPTIYTFPLLYQYYLTFSINPSLFLSYHDSFLDLTYDF